MQFLMNELSSTQQSPKNDVVHQSSRRKPRGNVKYASILQHSILGADDIIRACFHNICDCLVYCKGRSYVTPSPFQQVIVRLRNVSDLLGATNGRNMTSVQWICMYFWQPVFKQWTTSRYISRIIFAVDCPFPPCSHSLLQNLFFRSLPLDWGAYKSSIGNAIFLEYNAMVVQWSRRAMQIGRNDARQGTVVLELVSSGSRAQFWKGENTTGKKKKK